MRLNLTNYKNGIGKSLPASENEIDKISNRTMLEQKMSEAELEDFSGYTTAFSITTSVEMNMLFLSMPIAQNAIDGMVPNATFPIKETVYRGY